MKLISITGPESSGKTFLAKHLASYYNTLYVPECARIYLNKLERPYKQEDLTHIAREQLEAEELTIAQAQEKELPFIFCDTDFLVLKIWSEFKYGKADSLINTLWQQHRYKHSLLTYPDLPWEPDPQREHPQQRMRLFEIYETTLKVAKVPFTVIKGIGEQREQHAVDAVDGLLMKQKL